MLHWGPGVVGDESVVGGESVVGWGVRSGSIDIILGPPALPPAQRRPTRRHDSDSPCSMLNEVPHADPVLIWAFNPCCACFTLYDYAVIVL